MVPPLYSDKSCQERCPHYAPQKSLAVLRTPLKARPFNPYARPLCACVIGLGSNVSLSGWPSQLRLRDERHRIFLSLTSPFYGRLSMDMSKIHQNDILWRPSRKVTVCYRVALTQRHLQSFRPVSRLGDELQMQKWLEKFIGSHTQCT